MTDSAVHDLFTEYRMMKAETSVQVQEALDVKDRVRTSVLPWRGQFSPQLIEFLLRRHHAAHSVLDPFCGSGTVLYEGVALGRSTIGLDVNPAAVTLASFATYCRWSVDERVVLVDRYCKKIQAVLARWGEADLTLEFCGKLPRNPFYDCYLLSTFGDKMAVPPTRAAQVMQQLRSKMLGLPKSGSSIRASVGDARYTDLADESVDLVVTSPPYINVFNYHQNYRPVMEALGATPLSSAVAEIGANRKHRQNRFLTVIQYCIDMQAVFAELWRVLAPAATAVFIVGRSSKVRGVPFLNAQLIATVAALSETFCVQGKHERAFTNRFGERIYEDVLTLKKAERKTGAHGDDEVGRSIGSRALTDAAKSCTDKVAEMEIADAYARRNAVARSPRVS